MATIIALMMMMLLLTLILVTTITTNSSFCLAVVPPGNNDHNDDEEDNNISNDYVYGEEKNQSSSSSYVPNSNASSSSSSSPPLLGRSVGMLYSLWHTAPAQVMQTLQRENMPQLTVENVIRSNGKYHLDDIYPMKFLHGLKNDGTDPFPNSFLHLPHVPPENQHQQNGARRRIRKSRILQLQNNNNNNSNAGTYTDDGEYKNESNDNDSIFSLYQSLMNFNRDVLSAYEDDDYDDVDDSNIDAFDPPSMKQKQKQTGQQQKPKQKPAYRGLGYYHVEPADLGFYCLYEGVRGP